MRARSGSNTSAESVGGGLCKVLSDPRGFLAVPGIEPGTHGLGV